jgi:Xaa-Pro aminopeptidase
MTETIPTSATDAGTLETFDARLPEAFHRGRVAAIQQALDDQHLDGLLLLDAQNVRYASGFIHIPSERPLALYIPVSGEPALFVPLLEKEHAGETWVRDIRTYFEYPGEEHPLFWMARESGAKALGIDSIDHGQFARLSAAHVSLTLTPLVERMRWVKTTEELRLVERAARYADYCLEFVYANAAAIIRAGGTELDILNAAVGATAARMQAELGDTFELRGGAVVGTVHSGPRAALPHGRPGKRQPQAGETLIAGIGATVGGYHAESGATFILGEPNADQWHCLRSAAACDQAGVEALRAGNTCSAVNRAALGALESAGLSDAIRHRIGHGMGLEGHESPWLAPGDETIIVPGMVFSNEPGIYRPGLDGYRTINTMIVTDQEAHVPSRFLAAHPPEKRILPL